MNFHSDAWIQTQLETHFSYAQTIVPLKQIVGIFVYGSQNYGLDTCSSDIDTKVVVAPSMEDVILNRRPISTVKILPNGEHVEFKDIRLVMDMFRKCSPNWVEILFTRYKIINPFYAHLWDILCVKKNEIAYYNPSRALRVMASMSRNEWNKIQDEYNNKSAALVLRLRQLVFSYLTYDKYTLELSYPRAETVKEVKLGRMSEAAVMQEAKKAFEMTQSLVSYYLEANEEKEDETTQAFVNNMQARFCKKGLQTDD